MNKIKLTADPDLGILTFQNLSSEYYGGVPDNWVRCFIRRNEAETLPDYNRILYLRNVNIRPMVGSNFVSPILPIWHAAVVLAYDYEPARLLLIKETAVLDWLVAKISPLDLIEHDFPAADLGSIRVELDDLSESPQENANLTLTGAPINVLRGWPTETAQQSYLRTRKNAEEIARSRNEELIMDFTYVVETEHLDMKLRFAYCMATPQPNSQRFHQVSLIINNILCADEAW